VLFSLNSCILIASAENNVRNQEIGTIYFLKNKYLKWKKIGIDERLAYSIRTSCQSARVVVIIFLYSYSCMCGVNNFFVWLNYSISPKWLITNLTAIFYCCKYKKVFWYIYMHACFCHSNWQGILLKCTSPHLKRLVVCYAKLSLMRTSLITWMVVASGWNVIHKLSRGMHLQCASLYIYGALFVLPLF